MAFAFHEQKDEVLLYEERAAPWARGLIVGIGLAMLGGAGGFLALFMLHASAPAVSLAGSGLSLLGAAAFVALGVFLLRLGWLGPARNILFDGRAGEIVCTSRSLSGRGKHERHRYADVAEIRVATHEFEGSLADFSVEIVTAAGETIGLGFWNRRGEAEAWATRLRDRIDLRDGSG